MRFYFHLHNDVHTVDEEGRELPDAGAAFAEARDEARAMAAESVRHGSLDLSHHVEVTDESGAVLFKLTFGEVVSISHQEGAPAGST